MESAKWSSVEKYWLGSSSANADLHWTALRTETNYPLGINLELVDINTNSNYQYYKLFVVQSNQAGSNPGLKHFQIYVYSE